MTLSVLKISPSSYFEKPYGGAFFDKTADCRWISQPSCSFTGIKNHEESSRSEQCDTFETPKKEISYARFLKGKGKVTKEEYEEIKANNPSIFKEAKRNIGLFSMSVFSPKEMAHVVLEADKYFKNNFKNYRIISIGTSPAAITEQLANLGHEVVFLPVSGMMVTKEENVHKGIHTKQLKALLDYLSAKNINDGKLNIILDYTRTGKSLEYISEIIKNEFGLEDDKIKPVSLNDVLGCSSDKASKKILKKLGNAKSVRMEFTSNVPHYAANDAMEIYMKKHLNYFSNTSVFFEEGIDLEEKFEDYSSAFARAFSLCTMHEIDKIQTENNKHSCE